MISRTFTCDRCDRKEPGTPGVPDGWIQLESSNNTGKPPWLGHICTACSGSWSDWLFRRRPQDRKE
ncbi:hypothetical protein [Novosphingobium sp. KN65.2]|uniref:hypothetical protein n=1 Tax=Novosphingobium sp. KN65.2 TaxID=1478134 RepID=UPI0005E34698|nr:hypothetical protein [Novosphingobium sp. KN65.2]CDO34009.1 hypothetical protein SPHV1_100043 [Novosphingobium sp. KN65.2]